MMNRLYYIPALLLLGLVACDPMEDIDRDLDNAREPIGQDVTYTLADADYSTVANVAFAKKTKADSAAGKTIRDKKYFSADAKIATYLPDFLAARYPGLQGNSSVNVTYNFYEGNFTVIPASVMTAGDYLKVGGDVARYLCFTKVSDNRNMSKYLGTDAEDGDQKIVTYNVVASGETIGTQTEKVVDMEMNKYDYQVLMDWVKKEKPSFVPADGTSEYWFGSSPSKGNFDVRDTVWDDYTREGNPTVNSAYITGQIQSGILLLLKNKIGKAAVKDVIYNVRYGTYGPAAVAKVQTFRCTAAGDAPVFELVADPVVPVRTQTVTQVFRFSSKYKDWSATTTDLYVVNADDYKLMGISGYPSFDDSKKAENYLPQLLTTRFPFAQEKASLHVIYVKDNTKAYVQYIDDYTFTEGKWVKYAPVIEKTDQFIYSAGKWVFDPTVNYTMVKADYDVLIQWVKNNKNGYFDAKYKNSEYWFGASTYKDNFDVRLAIRKTNDPDKLLAGKGDDEIVTILNDQVQKGIVLLLETLYPDAQPQKDGLDMFYKVTYKTTDGADHKFVVTYQCVSAGKFNLVGEPEEIK